MCGIVGYLGGAGADNDDAVLRRMTGAIGHRGPDSAGYWRDLDQSIWLGHRRLSIVDLSPAGSQPMASGSRRYVMVFNGEIYNHQVLRAMLMATDRRGAWRGHSDTETLLAGFDAWGIQGTLERAVGMFALAVWDRDTTTLTLARDRMGEKPLYYGWQGSGANAVFLFGSELKALRAHPAFESRVDRGALALQLRHGYIPAPHSIHEGISKLPAGCLLSVSLRNRKPALSRYWHGDLIARDGARHAYAGSAADAVKDLECLLMEAVGQQMVADVPLGAFLSGGIDSSLVVALMQAQSSRPVKTFTIGFGDQRFNEAEHALAVARHLGTDHTELYISGAEALEVIPALPTIYDEPFSDPSQIPTYLVSRLARRHVTVALSGDGGDELFCGYGRYRSAVSLWQRLSGLPVPLRGLLGRTMQMVPPAAWHMLQGAAAWAGLGDHHATSMEHKAGKAAAMLRDGSLRNVYRLLVSHWHDPACVLLDSGPAQDLFAHARPDHALDPMQQLMLLDAQTYLPDDILVKVDRAAMAASLETRTPFLDHRVVEFAWRLPQQMKLCNGRGKWALRQVLERHVPLALIDRPKMGFGVPVGSWLKGPLRDWAESLLDAGRLQREGYFAVTPLRRKWAEHLSGKHNWEYQLWDVLMFQSWLAHNQGLEATDQPLPASTCQEA
ncbi:MAG: asparagine synthase (glutamine-hydrolyzing) [Burkholderiaceae bacterium]